MAGLQKVLTLSEENRDRLATMHEWRDRKLTGLKDEKHPF